MALKVVNNETKSHGKSLFLNFRHNKITSKLYDMHFVWLILFALAHL